MERTDNMQEIIMIASGYEWDCPECGEFNTEIETKEKVLCRACGRKFIVNEVYHAHG